MARMYYDADANLDLLANKTIAIIGYGSQGHAHALNLKDSGLNVIVGLYPGSKSAQKAEKAGLTVHTVADAAKAADFIMILLPDEVQKTVYTNEIASRRTAPSGRHPTGGIAPGGMRFTSGADPIHGPRSQLSRFERHTAVRRPDGKARDSRSG